MSAIRLSDGNLFDPRKASKGLVGKKSLAQITDTSEIEAIVLQVVENNPGSAEDYRDGTKKAIGFLVGQVMRATRGKANPQLVNQILTRVLSTD